MFFKKFVSLINSLRGKNSDENYNVKKYTTTTTTTTTNTTTTNTNINTNTNTTTNTNTNTTSNTNTTTIPGFTFHRGGCFFALISIFTVFGRFFFTYSLTLYDGAI